MARDSVVLYVATSLDGYLATPEGAVDWLEPFDDGGESGYEEFLAGVDCLLVGGRTYEQVRSFGEWPYGDLPTYVVSHRDLPRATERVAVRSEDPATLARRLRRTCGTVWVVGGAQVAQRVLDDDAVDEIRVTAAPLLLGEGIHLFAGDAGRHDLDLLDVHRRANGLVELHYRVRADSTA